MSLSYYPQCPTPSPSRLYLSDTVTFHIIHGESYYCCLFVRLFFLMCQGYYLSLRKLSKIGSTLNKSVTFFVGENVAFYFGWMTCFTWTLVPIAFAGVLLYFFKPPGVTVDDNPLLPLYEVLMAFWAISFLTVCKTW